MTSSRFFLSKRNYSSFGLVVCGTRKKICRGPVWKKYDCIEKTSLAWELGEGLDKDAFCHRATIRREINNTKTWHLVGVSYPHTFLSFSVVSPFADLLINPSTPNLTHSASDSPFSRPGVKMFSRSALAGWNGLGRTFSLLPEAAFYGPAVVNAIKPPLSWPLVGIYIAASPKDQTRWSQRLMR